MGLPEQLQKLVANPYERKARLYPAFLAAAPVLGIAAGLYGLSLEIKDGLVALVSAFGGFYLLANIVREYGKRIEERLYARWGGVPTTQIQRHRDVRIDEITKISRHAFLAGKIGHPFPTSAAEVSDPGAADQTYAAGTRWLIEHTRDRVKFSILFEENIAYGYRRNALGIKPIAIAICVLAILWVLGVEGVLGARGFDRLALFRMSRGAVVSLGASTIMLGVWIFFFTTRTVKTAAFAYADMLLRACTVLA